MIDPKEIFDHQFLTISNESYTIEISFEGGFCEQKTLGHLGCDKVIELNEPTQKPSVLFLKTVYPNQPQKTCTILGIDGGIYLHTADDKDNSYSVKLSDNCLILSLGFTFLCFDLIAQDIIWHIRPDHAEIFEFYDLQDDYLLRGEYAIHRIDKNGNVKWSYGGMDIWVNIDGKSEVIIESDKILLTDFYNNEYVINYEGKTMKDSQSGNRTEKQKSKWWKIW
jgi:hypothetical protein